MEKREQEGVETVCFLVTYSNKKNISVAYLEYHLRMLIADNFPIRYIEQERIAAESGNKKIMEYSKKISLEIPNKGEGRDVMDKVKKELLEILGISENGSDFYVCEL